MQTLSETQQLQLHPGGGAFSHRQALVFPRTAFLLNSPVQTALSDLSLLCRCLQAAPLRSLSSVHEPPPASPGPFSAPPVLVLLPSLLSLGCPSTVLQPASWLISPSAPLPSPVHFCLPFSCPQPRLLSVPGRQKAHIMQVGVTPDSCSPESLCPSPGAVLAPWGFFSNVPPCSTPFS